MVSFLASLGLNCKSYLAAELASAVWQRWNRSSFKDCANAYLVAMMVRCPRCYRSKIRERKGLDGKVAGKFGLLEKQQEGVRARTVEVERHGKRTLVHPCPDWLDGWNVAVRRSCEFQPH